MKTYITRNPTLFNASATLDWKHYYDSYAELGEVEFMIHEVGQSYLCLPFTKINSDIICSGRSFVGGFITTEMSPDDYRKYMNHCFNYLYKAGFKHVIHKELPKFYEYQTGFSEWRLDLFHKSIVDIGETSIVYKNNFKMSENRRRLYSKYQRNFTIKQVRSDEEIRDYWNFLSHSLSDRNLGTIPLDRIHFLISILGHRYKLFGIDNRNKRIAGTVLIDNYLGVSRLVNYFFSKDIESKGAFETFLSIYVESEINEFTIMDFGSSSNPNTGEIVSSILKFKKTFNTEQLPTFQRKYLLTGL
jgi:hypothetical protein